MSEMINVRIQTSQKVYYDQIVEMTPEAWAKLKATPEKVMESEDMGPLTSLLRVNDFSNWHDYEEPELTVVDADGKPVKPDDYYYPV